jgi:demethylmenaquinone methyltransferase/2-methoxy-6-polyprenyl-1,4-benzoquinol methylase
LQLYFLSVQVKPNQDSALSKKQQVAQMFDDISGRYDFLNRLLSLGIDRGWRTKVRKALSAAHHSRILDVATGTADLAIELSKIKDANITGIDISAGMLKKGDEKIARAGLNSQIRLQLADSENLPFEDAHFDAVTVAFGVRNFENLQSGIREMLRVTRPGGHLYILEFSKPKNRFFSGLYWFYFKKVLPGVGKLISSSVNAYSYLPRSVEAFPEGAEFASIVQDCGAKSVIIKPLTFGVSSLYICEK